MNKVLLAISFLVFALGVTVANLYVLPVNFEEIPYPKYREEYAYNLKNPLAERYRQMAMDSPQEGCED